MYQRFVRVCLLTSVRALALFNSKSFLNTAGRHSLESNGIAAKQHLLINCSDLVQGKWSQSMQHLVCCFKFDSAVSAVLEPTPQ